MEGSLEGLLTLFVALTALAVITQAGVLVGIYIMSKRLSEQIERFMKETREMISPMKSITENLRSASANLVEIGLSAREQFRRVEAMVTDTGEALHIQLERFDRVSQNVVERINETAGAVLCFVRRPEPPTGGFGTGPVPVGVKIFFRSVPGALVLGAA